MFSKADLHIHTRYSPDCFNPIAASAKKAVKRGLHVIAVTDHNEIKGAYEMEKYVEENELDLNVIIGEEISTLQGHIIALFIKRRIPPNLTLREAITAVKQQGGLVIIPHLSFSKKIQSEYCHRMRIHYQNLIDQPEILDMIDGIEAENFTLAEPDYSSKARFFNQKILNKCEIGSSDTHILKHIGLAYTFFEGETLEDLKRAILQKQTQANIARFAEFTDVILFYVSAARIPFFFLWEKFSAFCRATYFILRRYASYRNFSQQTYHEVVHKIIDAAKKINKRKNAFYYEDRRIFKNQPKQKLTELQTKKLSVRD